ncbi:hypothetical protein MSIMFI_05249 [Mycobacterium simulans]|nr:hypothetical protein [Mycobacterium simulans]SON63718.1 hypothetical protein MSIMFI_05249 [Mycobacterium simulans]
MQHIDDRFEHAATVVTPACGVKRDRELAITAGVHRINAIDEPSYRRRLFKPVLRRLGDPRANATAAMPQECLQQLVPCPEVMRDARIGDAELLGDGTHLNGPRATQNQELLGRLKDRRFRFLRLTPDTLRGHTVSLT